MIKWAAVAPIDTDQSQQFGPRKIACARSEPINIEKKQKTGIYLRFLRQPKQLILLFVVAFAYVQPVIADKRVLVAVVSGVIQGPAETVHWRILGGESTKNNFKKDTHYK